jgi:hypothetical protein
MKRWSVVIILIFIIGSIASVLYALVFRLKASCFQPDSKGVAEVKAVSWNPNTQTLSFKQGLFRSPKNLFLFFPSLVISQTGGEETRPTPAA